YFQAEDGIRDFHVTGVQTCALPISGVARGRPGPGRVPRRRDRLGEPLRGAAPRSGREERGQAPGFLEHEAGLLSAAGLLSSAGLLGSAGVLGSAGRAGWLDLRGAGLRRLLGARPQLVHQVAHLGFAFEVAHEDVARVDELLLVSEAVPRPRRDLLSTRGEILFDGVRVARQLTA